MNPDAQAAWRTLSRLAPESIKHPLKDLTATPGRFENFSYEGAGLLLDLSRQRLNAEIVEALLTLADEQALTARREALFSGAHLNTTEDRAALHTALRAPTAERPAAAGAAHAVEERLEQVTAAVRSGRWRGATDKAITDVVHIGIGGSHLGPELVVQALKARPADAPRIHFVANLDDHALTSTLARLNPEQTLFLIVSKSFTTLETRVNAGSARSWFLERTADPGAISRHFLAVSSNPEVTAEFGIPDENRFELWDWVGGRFSLWSAVGLPIMLSAGNDAFQRLKAGAHAMDEHFRNAEPSANLPLLLALTGIWNYNFLGATNHAILPYSERLALLPSFLQQLMMESNGKRVHTAGAEVAVHTMPVVWGGAGTKGQHAFHQLLHQGTRAFTADFILCAEDERSSGERHRWLLANALAQSQAMLNGDDSSDPHKRVPGNHATSSIVLPRLDPESLGALLALYEHVVFCQGVVWDINSFDQWGVELGKRLAKPIYDQLGGASTLAQDEPTRGMVGYLRRLDQANTQQQTKGS